MKQAKRLTRKQKHAAREALLVSGVVIDPRDLKNLPPGYYTARGDVAAALIAYEVDRCLKNT